MQCKKMDRGSFFNYVDKVLPIINHLLPLVSVDIWEGITLLLQRKICISLTFSVPPTYLVQSTQLKNDPCQGNDKSAIFQKSFTDILMSEYDNKSYLQCNKKLNCPPNKRSVFLSWFANSKFIAMFTHHFLYVFKIKYQNYQYLFLPKNKLFASLLLKKQVSMVTPN